MAGHGTAGLVGARQGKVNKKEKIMSKRIPSISIESQEVVRRLEKCAVGEVIAYEELSKIAMGDIQSEKHFALQTARKVLLKENGWVFECVVNTGVKRLNDAEILQLGESEVGKIHNAARRTTAKLSCVDYDSLTREQQISHNARMSITSTLAHITKAKQVKQIECAVEKSQSRLLVAETLAAFERPKNNVAEIKAEKAS
jgi:hypothetical protein